MNAPTAAPTVTLAPIDLLALQLIADGLTVDQVGARLRVGKSAIQMRMFRLRARLGATTNAHAVAIAYRTGQLTVTARPPERAG
ncbi:hypothetical protein EYA84_02205 [Verrucosispora sp. SN26_14.1]|uniref:hypothetical protein n=1 Tax=Verrucosispora sp. SN26_14.1 TaxID=2527879 RepID=UPI0010348AC6|nr:hypothetical protein [Verrucosispora sp. SN26_14.1]TBL44276.1 hypothetical protein EYA84_02205 [Verrucosispora sp. SN26_14.1]